MKKVSVFSLIVTATLLVSCNMIAPRQDTPVMEPEAGMMQSSQSSQAQDMNEGVQAMPNEGAEGEYEMDDGNGNMVRNDDMIDSYEACIAAGYAMMKSMPPQCATANGKVFTQGGGMRNENAEVKEEHFGDYSLYGDGVIGNGSESVLFFHAAWCPYCIKNDALLKAWYEQERQPRSTYKIDYDTAGDLKKQFGVTNQDTFILIDGSGNEIKRVTFPSESALRELLG